MPLPLDCPLESDPRVPQTSNYRGPEEPVAVQPGVVAMILVFIKYRHIHLPIVPPLPPSGHFEGPWEGRQRYRRQKQWPVGKPLQ